MKRDNRFPKISLGTVQWGMPYGIANKTGQPNFDEILRILNVASANGITTLDTARSYGSSESVIGEAIKQLNLDFRVITKLSPDIFSTEMSDQEILINVDYSLRESMSQLQVDVLDTVLLHRGFHRNINGGIIWEFLRNLRKSGVVRKIGVSAVNPTEALEALDDSSVEVLQVASSLMDRRLITRNFFETANNRGIEVHVRSIFLQGIAHLDVSEIPKTLEPLRPEIMKINNAATRMGAQSIDLWINHVLMLKPSRMIMGTDNLEQLVNNIERVKNLTMKPLVYDFAELENLPDQYLDPSLWVQN